MDDSIETGEETKKGENISLQQSRKRRVKREEKNIPECGWP